MYNLVRYERTIPEGKLHRSVPPLPPPPPPGPAVIAKGTIKNFGKWVLDENGLLTIYGNGKMPNWGWREDIPNTAPWYSYRQQIQKVFLSKGITHIGSNAFAKCHSLTSIEISNGVTYIYAYAFDECKKLSHMSIPNGVELIDVGVFNGCDRLVTIDLPDSLREIRGYAFSGCKNLTQIDIPCNIWNLGEGIFENCHNLRKVSMPACLNQNFFLKDTYGVGLATIVTFRKFYGISKSVITFY